MRGRIYVPIKCQNVPDSFTSHIVGFIFRRNMRSGSFYTPVSRDSDVFRRLVVKV